VLDKKIISFEESLEIISAIDKAADQQGLNRSGWIRQVIRQKLQPMGN
jgi:hypothetical protein